MKLRSEKGYLIILVAAMFAIIALVGWAVVDLGCGEMLQTRTRNDMIRAQYVAFAGAEIMYAMLKSKEGTSVDFNLQVIPTLDRNVGTLGPNSGDIVGTFNVSADMIASHSDEFGIASSGAVNGRSANLTVKYHCEPTPSYGYPVGSIGDMELSGDQWLFFRSWVRADGPIVSNGSITTNNYVQISGDKSPNMTPPIPSISFWYKFDGDGNLVSKAVGDANGDGQYLFDTNMDGSITIADAGGVPEQEAVFAADDTVADGQINDLDAFYTYYTSELNSRDSLQIGPGQTNYYNGNQNFGPFGVPAGTPIIFVKGDVNVLFNDTQWWGASNNHTIIATGDITIVQPTNGADDTLTLVSFRDVATGGVNLFAGVKGNLVIYAHDDFYAYYGGKSNGTIFSEGETYIDTVYPIPGLLNRDLNKNTVDWSGMEDELLARGLPPNYNTAKRDFKISNEAIYKPVFQRY